MWICPCVTHACRHTCTTAIATARDPRIPIDSADLSERSNTLICQDQPSEHCSEIGHPADIGDEGESLQGSEVLGGQFQVLPDGSIGHAAERFGDENHRRGPAATARSITGISVSR